ncbi:MULTISPECIES: protein-tyrosine phosphatase family protein [unclassified Chelatococcus]|uniref:tyrosine phosphatase family protein n=1 Tax=unclassified Chelatococcus TaxID=2638111 RepID=UPI001BD08D11|nr:MULTISPECIES: protein-tyrosine phosphatase family protein [unclassified Chelatococcus]MBS7698312.1 dual specificity protein phosphatase family protein [Chelatococcus sp. YT9]MBX3559169.1 dual specificity protein phosphatase family protein [Chelatococcus sp.]
MPAIHVCPLSRLSETVAASSASHLISLTSGDITTATPDAIAADHHLSIRMSDIVAPLDGHVLPDVEHVDALLAFVHNWPREHPLVIHCFAGISRSTAAALVSFCALNANQDAAEAANVLRLASPSATPNIRFIEVADARLGYEGQLVAATHAIGRGCDAFEGEPFALPLHNA